MDGFTCWKRLSSIANSPEREVSLHPTCPWSLSHNLKLTGLKANTERSKTYCRSHRCRRECSFLLFTMPMDPIFTTSRSCLSLMDRSMKKRLRCSESFVGPPQEFVRSFRIQRFGPAGANHTKRFFSAVEHPGLLVARAGTARSKLG